MIVYTFSEMFESVATHKGIRPEKLPYCNTLQSKGYRIARIDGESYAFTKDYEAEDEVYWLGVTNKEFTFGKKYLATTDLLYNKEKLPFYCLYSRCDDSLTPEQQKLRLKFDKEHQKLLDQKKKEKEKKKKTKK
jgi:hypothetical protein